MNDLLQGIILDLVQLVADLGENEKRPSAQELINRIGRLAAMAQTLQQNLQLVPRTEPYKMDSPTIDQIEAAINAGNRITIETDGSVMVYPAGTATPTEAMPPAPAPVESPVLPSAGDGAAADADVERIESRTETGSGVSS